MTRLALILALFLAPLVASAATHPMDPLSPEEMEATLQVLVKSGKVQRQARMAYMRLYEMEKADVLAWKPGEKITRTSEAFVNQPDGFYRARVSLDSGEIVAWDPVESGQAPLTGSDFLSAMSVLTNHEEWLEALSKRGLAEPKKAIAVIFSVGYFDDTMEKERRLTRVAAYYPEDTPNLWGRPIGGLSALVDLTNRNVVEVIDTGVVPVPGGTVDYSNADVGTQSDPVNPIRYDQPAGPSYTTNGHTVSWQKWAMHLRIDPQVGLVLSNMTYDGRSVLYQASVSELFVPYMDPDPAWYSRTFIDAGEYGLGFTLTPIHRGMECPENASLFGTTLAGINGKPQDFPDVLAIFERYSGNPAWRHNDPIAMTKETRRDQELVLRTIATVGNYDYILDWVFCMDGTIHVKAGATGILSTKAVTPKNAAEDPGSDETRFGRFVDEHTLAVNHDHFISYRLDFDVDGTKNDFVRDVLRPVTVSPASPRRGGWVVDTQVAETEQDVQLRMNVQTPSMWRVRSTERSNAWGHPTSFMIKPGSPHISLLPDDDWPQKRAGFSKYSLWMTAYDRDQKFAAGPFPNQSDGTGGLPDWIDDNASVRDTDIVAWYTLGFHHIARAEDWPVMPVEWSSFCIKPFDFMDENPVMDLPGAN